MNDSPRDQMKKRFHEEGLDSFDQQELLELLLFYASSPKKDVADLAQRLLERFGSATEVFDAPVPDLVCVKGMTDHMAILMKMIPEISRKYMLSKISDTTDFSDINKVGKYLTSYYIGVNVETVVLVLLDSKNKWINLTKVHEGSVNSAAVTMRKLAETALFQHAAKVILAHNHPSGTTRPSRADMDLTMRVKNLFRVMEIEFLGHIIVAGNEFSIIGNAQKKSLSK
jgi:DNA repair protein RadC